MAGSGFEPLKHEAADLQSAPFDHLGNPPAVSVRSELQTATLLFCHEIATNARLRHAESKTFMQKASYLAKNPLFLNFRKLSKLCH